MPRMSMITPWVRNTCQCSLTVSLTALCMSLRVGFEALMDSCRGRRKHSLGIDYVECLISENDSPPMYCHNQEALPDKKSHVSAELRDGWIVISMKDNGKPIFGFDALP